MVKIGITEAGDAAFEMEKWVENPYPVNVIITKQLNAWDDRLYRALLDNAQKTILHVTCTGYGGTVVEPGVPQPLEVYVGLRALIHGGFPVSHVVLRTDPIIPTKKGIETVKGVWEQFSDLGISRCRYSVIDMYPHVRERFMKELHTIPFDGFRAPQYMLDAVEEAVRSCPYYTFESCAESFADKVGCISKKDFDILGLPFEQEAGGFQRKGCLCCAGKTEMLTGRKRCPSQCLYCYWRD